jgi:hypothetical protein
MVGRISLAAAGLALGAALPAAGQEQPGLLELTDQGYLHCNHPNVRAKTCRSVDVFERINDGVYNSTSLIAAGNGMTVEIYTPVWVIEGEFCGTLREQDIMTAVVRLNGREVAPQLAAAGLQRVLDDNRRLVDQEFCVLFEPSGTGFVARTLVAGEHRPEFDSPIRLVKPTDGYRVAR